METVFNVFLICFTLPILIYGDQASETTANTVQLTFYRLTKSIWDANNMEITFSAYIAEGANNYCRNNPNACGLYTYDSNAAFKEVDIGKVSGYPKDSKKNLLQKLYINFPTGSDISNSSSTDYVLPNTAVIAIITSIRVDLHTAIGYWITWADTEYYGIPPPTRENAIIIPIACVVLLLIIILAVALNVWNKRKEHDERIQKRIEMKKAKKKEKEGTPYNLSTETEVPKVEKKIRRKKVTKNSRNNLYDDDGKLDETDHGIKTETNKKTLGGASDTDSAIKMEDGKNNDMESVDEVATRFQALPPLQQEDPETEKIEKKKKKKKKKHRSARKAESQEHIIQGDYSTHTTEL